MRKFFGLLVSDCEVVAYFSFEDASKVFTFKVLEGDFIEVFEMFCAEVIEVFCVKVLVSEFLLSIECLVV